MEIKLPSGVEYVIKTLEENGYEAYIVGGCVRDKIRDVEPMDWDITTSAKPFEVKKLFQRTVDTGIAHGTVTVIIDSSSYEVTTYRIDGEYTDNRHPGSVEYTANLKEDLKRRDFTINAMAYNPTTGLIDIFNGINDLYHGIIRCVGNPDERFNEDGLRMLRCIRFASQLSFEIEDETYDAIVKNAELIKNISMERIRDEVTKILVSDNAQNIMLLNDTGILEYILPEFIPNVGCSQNTPWHKYTVDEHIIRTVLNIDKKIDLRWTMLLHDIAKAKSKVVDEHGYDHFPGHAAEGAIMAEKILERFRFDNKTLRKVVRLIKYHDTTMPLDEAELRKKIAEIGEDLFLDLMKVMDADDDAKANLVWLESQEKTGALRQMFKIFKDQNYCLSKEELDISGEDLKELGYQEGKEIGVVLDELFDIVLEEPELNDNFELRQIAKKKLQSKTE